MKERYKEPRANNMLEGVVEPALFSRALALAVADVDAEVAEELWIETVAKVLDVFSPIAVVGFAPAADSLTTEVDAPTVFSAPGFSPVTTTVLVTVTIVSSPPGATDVSAVTKVVAEFLASALVSGAATVIVVLTPETVVTTVLVTSSAVVVSVPVFSSPFSIASVTVVTSTAGQ